MRELQAATEDRFGPLPEPVENLFLIQEAKLKLARVGADYLVFRGGKASVGQMVLGSEELRDLRRRVDTAVYSTGKPRDHVCARTVFRRRSDWSMLYWPRVRQREEIRCKWRFFHETTPSDLRSASLALLAAGCGGTSTANLGSDDVAVVGSQQVSKEQFQELMARAKKSYDTQKRPFPKPGSTEYEQLKGQAVTYPRPAGGGGGAGFGRRHRHQRRQGRQGDRALQEAVLRRQRRSATRRRSRRRG